MTISECSGYQHTANVTSRRNNGRSHKPLIQNGKPITKSVDPLNFSEIRFKCGFNALIFIYLNLSKGSAIQTEVNCS